ncbi:MAG: hypothetical protein ABJM29_19730 [Rhizobiaceae bacterium]
MRDNLKILIKGYADVSMQLEMAISESPWYELEGVKRYDKKLTSIFDEILKLDPQPEQRLTRIEFVSDLFLTNYVGEDTLGSRMISIILADAQHLHDAAHR